MLYHFLLYNLQIGVQICAVFMPLSARCARLQHFLQAGASIVADNMQGLDSAGVNAMVPGRKPPSKFSIGGQQHYERDVHQFSI